MNPILIVLPILSLLMFDLGLTLRLDDFALLAAKLAPTATKLDVQGAGIWEADWEVIKNKCPGITIVTNEGTVGISAVSTQQASTVYSLSGVRMAEPTAKGIYIINGKKIVK